MSELTAKLNLRKNIILNLKKSKGLDGQVASVCAVYDYSGSMEHLYQNGFMQSLTERILPVGLGFDDDQSVDLYVFHNQAFAHKNPITVSNITQIVPEIQKTYQYGGTSYAPAINLILDKWIGKKSSGLFSSGKRPEKKLDNPVFVLYFTDGQNDDANATVAAMREASKYGIFFQFIGIGSARFDFLQKLDDLDGRNIDNADFFQCNNINAITDEDLYNRLMTEFPNFVKEARNKNLIK